MRQQYPHTRLIWLKTTRCGSPILAITAQWNTTKGVLDSAPAQWVEFGATSPRA